MSSAMPSKCINILYKHDLSDTGEKNNPWETVYSDHILMIILANIHRTLTLLQVVLLFLSRWILATALWPKHNMGALSLIVIDARSREEQIQALNSSQLTPARTLSTPYSAAWNQTLCVSVWMVCWEPERRVTPPPQTRGVEENGELKWSSHHMVSYSCKPYIYCCPSPGSSPGCLPVRQSGLTSDPEEAQPLR